MCSNINPGTESAFYDSTTQGFQFLANVVFLIDKELIDRHTICQFNGNNDANLAANLTLPSS